MPKTLFLDGNIYNRLEADVSGRSRLVRLIALGAVRVIATPVLVDALASSPFGGLPGWFPIAVEAESVFALGHARLGMARLGGGEIYTGHRGESGKIVDAIIADSAHSLADVLVSDDQRCRKRLAEASSRCLDIGYEEFLSGSTRSSMVRTRLRFDDQMEPTPLACSRMPSGAAHWHVDSRNKAERTWRLARQVSKLC